MMAFVEAMAGMMFLTTPPVSCHVTPCVQQLSLLRRHQHQTRDADFVPEAPQQVVQGDDGRTSATGLTAYQHQNLMALHRLCWRNCGLNRVL